MPFFSGNQNGVVAGDQPWNRDVQVREMQNKLPGGYQYEYSSSPPGTEQPFRPGFGSMLDPATGKMVQDYQLGGSYNSAAIDKLRGTATEQGPSMWATLQKGQQGAFSDQASAGQLSQAKNQMAMQGGLRGSSANRLQDASVQNNLLAKQNIARGVNLADEQRKQQALGQLLPQEMGLAQFQTEGEQYNIDNALKEIAMKREADMAAYNEALKQWGTVKAAQIQNPGSSGGGLGTGLDINAGVGTDGTYDVGLGAIGSVLMGPIGWAGGLF